MIYFKVPSVNAVCSADNLHEIMKCQALFFLKNNNKKQNNDEINLYFKVPPAVIVIGILLRV